MLTRREAIGSLGAAALLSTAGGAALSQPASARKGPRLRPGDTIGVVQPAGWIAEHTAIDTALERVRAMGLVPKPGDHLRDRQGYLAGSDQARAADINAMFADPSVKAIFAARGGWGCARILPYLNWDVIRANPKLLVGFSDITALHLAIAARAGFPTIHGPNIGSEWGARSADSFHRLAFEGGMPMLEDVPLPAPVSTSGPIATPSGPIATPTGPIAISVSPPFPPPPGFIPSPGVQPLPAPLIPPPRRSITVTPGRATGRLLGGNLTVLSTLMGTPYLPSFRGAILFIEDVEEAPYRIDRMLTQLGLAGLLSGLAGLVFGQCARCVTGPVAPGSFTLDDIYARHFRGLGVPVFTGAWFGHVSNQFNLPVGIRVEIDAAAATIRPLEPAVA